MTINCEINQEGTWVPKAEDTRHAAELQRRRQRLVEERRQKHLESERYRILMSMGRA